MDIKITPSILHGTAAAIPSKSAAHRSLLCAALADRDTALKLKKRSQDMDATINCLQALGANIRISDGNIRIMPIKQPAQNPTLDCRESGSTLRFLLPVAAALCGSASFAGCGRLPQRPLSPLMEEMEAHGASFSARRLPFTVTKLTAGGTFTLPGNVSSQYITGLLLAAPLLKDGAEIVLSSPLESSGYVEMTIAEMQKFGVRVRRTANTFSVKQGKYRSPGSLSVEGDWSNAAFWLAAGAIAGQTAVAGLDLHSGQGDRQIVNLLREFGAGVEEKEGHISVSPAPLHALEIDVSDIPDLVPILAVVASISEGETHIKNAARLRLKESDRIFTTGQMLSSLGADARELPDGLIITGKRRLAGGTVPSFGDHRIAMAAAIAACVCDFPVTITGAEAADKSYPSFWQDYKALGGVLDVI